MDQIDLFKDWAAAQTVTLTAALIAVLGVAATILTTANRTRREHRAGLYADALSAVADYLEGPYRIRRKDGTPAHRNAISAGLSDVKAAIDHSQTLLRLHAPPGVADAYDDYVDAAKREAGQQMHQAWIAPPISRDSEVNLHAAYDRTLSDRYRRQVVDVMQADLSRRWWKPTRRYARSVGRRLGPPPPQRAGSRGPVSQPRPTTPGDPSDADAPDKPTGRIPKPPVIPHNCRMLSE